MATAVPTRSIPHKILCKGGGINPRFEMMEYAVRGELVLRAEDLARQLRTEAASELPFERVTYCNIGNPQSLGQKPITFVRQVLSAVVCPTLLDSPAVVKELPADVVARAREILHNSHGVGAYSESKGLPMIREHVAHAIKARDGGAPANPESIYLTNGASEGAKLLLSLLVRESTDGILIPIPQYPLYSATMTAVDGRQVGYYLDEEKGWSLSIGELTKRLTEARAKGTTVRGIVIINPGNPTGQVLSPANLKEIVRFCEREQLVILADEVYQKNVYEPSKPFTSFKKVVAELQSTVELASFHSVSKGLMGECGMRGGYMEVYNMSSHAEDMIYKAMSVSLCANVVGQVAVDLMMRPPKAGDPSYELYNKEVTDIYSSLKRKAALLADSLNTFQGVTCNSSEGAMYLFPRLDLPHGAVQEAKSRGMASPDVLYCMELLNATGICVVPGSGFGQEKGTLHFRTTFLPPENQIADVVEKMRSFHNSFFTKYTKK